MISDYGEEKKKKGGEEGPKLGKEESTKSQEEKRKNIKSLIDKIPTDKNALFGYQLDWAVIDNVSPFIGRFGRKVIEIKSSNDLFYRLGSSFGF